MKKKEKKEKKKKKVFILWLLLLSASLFIATTYAWFSSDMKIHINTMDIRIETMAGVQVSANAVNWTNTLALEDIVEAYKSYPNATNQIPETLAGCSTDGATSGGTMNMYYGSTREIGHDQFYLTAYKQTEINCYGDEQCRGKHYIAFDLFLLLNESANLVVTGESFVNNKSENILGGENSARIGFVYLGTTSDSLNASSAQYLANANGSVIWEPNYDTHAEHGIENALNIYGIETTATGAPRLPYKGINSEIKGHGVLLTETNSSPYFSDVNPQIATIKGFQDDQNIMNLPRGISKLRVYFWLEGQDVDMENEISGAELEFKLEMAVS